MAQHFNSIVRTKIVPPPRGKRTLMRPRASRVLAQALDYNEAQA